MKYFDLKRNWGRVKPHLADPKVQAVLARDFNKFTWKKFRERFEVGMTPRMFERVCWWWDHRGRQPQFWDYVGFGACHWLVNFALRLAERVRPSSPWRILTSHLHSTVWDGEDTLFEFNYQAFGISPSECFERAAVGDELRPGQERKTYMPLPSAA